MIIEKLEGHIQLKQIQRDQRITNGRGREVQFPQNRKDRKSESGIVCINYFSKILEGILLCGFILL
jgi:hypothetical protein